MLKKTQDPEGMLYCLSQVFVIGLQVIRTFNFIYISFCLCSYLMVLL